MHSVPSVVTLPHPSGYPVRTMSTAEPLPPLTEADVPAWVRLRRDKAGEPYLVVAWWPRLTRLTLPTRKRPTGHGWELRGQGSIAFLLLGLSGQLPWLVQQMPGTPWWLSIPAGFPVVVGSLSVFTEMFALDRAQARIHAARGRRPAGG